MPKTIFGTTEKSNFILNMSKATVRKWITGVLCACIVVPMIGGLFITFIPKETIKLNVLASILMGSFLYITGFTSVLFYIIQLLRKDISVKDCKASFLVFGLAAMAFASYYGVVLTSDSTGAVNLAILGEFGRYEGLLSLFAYFGIFLLASTVMKRSSVKNIFDIFIGGGILQGIVAVFQHIPWDFPSEFRKLPALILMKDVHLSSGLSDSPIFYGSFLTLAISIALTGAMYDKNVIRARVYGVSAVFMFMTGLFTSSVIPLIGSGAAIIIIALCELIADKDGTKFDEGLLRSSGKRLAALTAALAVVFALVFALQGIYLRDKSIAYTDSFYRLFICGSPSPRNYDSLWKIGAQRSFIIIKDHPILGTGPGLMGNYQILNEMSIDSIDRSYNEYLYVAATRGIPSLLLYLALLGITFVRLFKDMKEFMSDKEKWFRPALLTAVIAYSIQAFFSVSAITVAPFFWLMLGMAWSTFPEDRKKIPVSQTNAAKEQDKPSEKQEETKEGPKPSENQKKAQTEQKAPEKQKNVSAGQKKDYPKKSSKKKKKK